MNNNKTEIFQHEKIYGYKHDKFYDNVINVIQNEVNKINKEIFKNDSCKPKFIVSILYDDCKNQKMLLTIKHLGSTNTETLFPRQENIYGYDSLCDIMTNMYNQTM